MTSPIAVKGLREVQTAFKLAGTGVQKDLREGLKSAAEPVRYDAQRLAASISGISRGHIPWEQMRTGVTLSLVYVAPVQRGVKSRANARLRRPKFADLLLARSMNPALQTNISRVEKELEDVLDDLAKAWARV